MRGRDLGGLFGYRKIKIEIQTLTNLEMERTVGARVCCLLCKGEVFVCDFVVILFLTKKKHADLLTARYHIGTVMLNMCDILPGLPLTKICPSINFC